MMPAQLARAKRLWVSRHARMMPKAASWIGASELMREPPFPDFRSIQWTK